MTMQVSKRKILYFRLLFCALIFTVFSIPFSTFASRLYFEGANIINKSDVFEVVLKLDVEDANINAIEGSIKLPSNIRLRQIKDGGSLVTLWIEEPAIDGNYLSFSGIIPGGYKGELSPYWKGTRAGEVLSLIFEAQQTGLVSLAMTGDTKILLNDGEGTEGRLLREEFRFLIVERFPEIEDKSAVYEKDFNAPEDFKPEVTADPSLFDGQYFVVFKAQDKGVGINYYEIKEKRGKEIKDYRDLGWKRVESPYLLEDQSLKSFIYIKAVDRNGNTKVIVVSPPQSTSTNEIYIILVIIILVLFGLSRKRQRRKTRQRNGQA